MRTRSVNVFVDEHFFARHVKGVGFSVANRETAFTNPAQSATLPVAHVIVAFTTTLAVWRAVETGEPELHALALA